MIENIKAGIDITRRSFEDRFASSAFYNRQTQDEEHLKKILSFIETKAGMKILDLGTGSGYLAFPLAESNPGSEITGLDIVRNTLEANRKRAASEGIANLSFTDYDGIDFPFEDCSFDMVVTRYALHHFPDIDHSVGEISRILKSGGSLFISDPYPDECDKDRFIDELLRLKQDGHIQFYTKEEWVSICGRHGLNISDGFDSKIRFPLKKDTAPGYEKLMSRHGRTVTGSYHMEETDTEIYITQGVNNLLFVKK